MEKRIYYALAVAGIAFLVFLLFSPWVRAPEMDGATFNIFQTNALVGRINSEFAHLEALRDPAGIFAARTVLYPVWGGITLVLLLGYLLLIFKNHRRSLIAGVFAFMSGILLTFMYINDVFNTNGTRTFTGRIFDESFLTVTSSAFFMMVFSLISLSLSITVTAKYFSGRPLPEKNKRQTFVMPGEKKSVYIVNLLNDIKRDKLLYLILIVPLAYYFIFYYLPYVGLRMAFWEFNIINGFGDFIGWGRFEAFFTNDLFWRLLRNTLLLNIITLAWTFPLPILLAILFNELRSNKFRTLAQTISYIPRFISTMIIAGLLVNFLSPSSGLINIIRGWFGAEPIYFLMFPEYFRSVFVTQAIWTGVGFGSIIYYSSLRSIDTELYEAATIDGAGRLKQARYITLPGLSRTIAVMLILAVGGLLATNDQMILLIYTPTTYEVSDVIGTYLLRMSNMAQGSGNTVAGRLPDYSLSTAVGLFNGIVACFLVVSANKISKLLGDVSIF